MNLWTELDKYITNDIKLYQQNAFSTLIAGQIRAAHSFSPDLHPMLCRSWFANHPWPWRAWVFGPCKRRPCGATGECGIAENLCRSWKSPLKWPSQERIAAVKPRIHLFGHYHLGTWLGMIRIGVTMWGHNISYNSISLGMQSQWGKGDQPLVVAIQIEMIES